MRFFRSRRFKTVMFGLLTMLSSVIIGYGIAMTTRSSVLLPLAPDQIVVEASPTALPRRTAVLSANASVDDPTAVPTAPTSPTPQPTALTDDQPTSVWEHSISDSFDSSASGWLVRTTTRSSAGYRAGRYQLTISGQTDLGVSTALQADEYRLSADVSIQAGSAGLVFLAAEPTTFYRLLISGDGTYAIQSRQQDALSPINLVGWSESTALRRGPDAINRLRVERTGELVRCFANDHLLAELTLSDGSFTAQYGFALTDATGQGEATFDNLVAEYRAAQP